VLVGAWPLRVIVESLKVLVEARVLVKPCE
jgi:hypothetical protein